MYACVVNTVGTVSTLLGCQSCTVGNGIGFLELVGTTGGIIVLAFHTFLADMLFLNACIFDAVYAVMYAPSLVIFSCQL